MGKNKTIPKSTKKKTQPKPLHSLSMRERREWEERGGKADRLVANCSKSKLLYWC